MKVNARSNPIAGIIIAIIGIVLLAGTIVLYNVNNSKIEKSTEVTAKITEIDSEVRRTNKKNRIHYTIYVDFTYGDSTYEHYNLGYYTASMREGQDIPVYVYEGSNGIEVLTEGKGLSIGMAAFGVIMIITGAATTISAKKNRNA